MHIRKRGFILLIVGLMLGISLSSPAFTGNVIIEQSTNSLFPLWILTIILIAGSLLMMTSRMSLDAIIIPTESSTKRIRHKAQQGARAYKESGAKVIVASGGVMPYLAPQYKHEAAIVYEELRKAGIQPGEIRIDGTSRDTIENVRHSLQKLHGTGAREIGLVSYPAHLDRLEYIIAEGEKRRQYSTEHAIPSHRN